MAQVKRPAPNMPSSKPVSGKAQEEFTALKKKHNEIASWSMSPNSWDKIQINYTSTGNEEQAKTFLSAIALPNPEM